MPGTPIPAGKIVPKDYVYPNVSVNEHWHTPSSGGEICWNDLQYIARLNASIYQQNHTTDKYNRALDGELDHIPYIAASSNPTQGYNVHHHTSEFDGGLVLGGGMHDHRNNTNGGYAYSVYHPGTSLPAMAYEAEEVLSI